MPRVPRVRGAAALGLLALAGLLAGCTSAPPPAPTRTPSATVRPSGDGRFTIGTLLPATGSGAYLAAPIVAAVKVAVTDVNAAGGVNGKPVAWIPLDSGDASTSTAETSFAALVKDHVDVVIGPTSSAIAQRLLGSAQKAGVPLISPAAGYPQLAGQPDFFRTVPAFGHEGTALGSLLPRTGAQKVALVATQEALGGSIAAPLQAALAAHGGTLAASLAVPLTGADTGRIAAQAKAAAPDAVVLATPDNGDLTRSLITALTSAGLGGGKLWLTGENLADYSQSLPGGLLNGVHGILEGAPADAAFQARLTGASPGLGSFGFAPEAYDAVVLAALAADLAHDDAGTAVASHLIAASAGGIKCATYAECVDVLRTEPDIDYDGLSGTLNLDPSGAPTTASYGLYVYGAGNQYTLASTVRY